ncbi:MAG: H(+)/Cl(-) exchange transporter ClcA [Herbaspirillum frisingense]|uniref:H(+)/Cl(-) exchange transporter ClcA n=1 Tax=Herbaspirillum frisingense TaxID=92645 RepID=A0A7V8FWX6_9BURK|nr:MAG: H(+)/Cl(-) exchange transporter ClcA [Herbaspirillum frisingense]
MSKNVLAGLHGHGRRHARRLWLQYGILWTGAIVTGLVAVLYARLIELGFELFQGMEHEHRWLPLILTPAASALCVWLTRKYFPGSEGSGIPQVIAALGEQGHHTSRLASSLLTLRIVAGKIGLSFVAILSGFTIGREGPTVQVGAALMYNMRRFYPRSSVILEKRLILAGAAAGLAAAFNTPLAGIVFAIEELSRSFEQRASGVVITTIIFAGVVALGLTGNYTYFGTITAGADSAREVIVAVILCGLLMGGAGGCFCWLLLNTPQWIPAPLLALRTQRPVVFGALCGLLVAVIGVLAGGATFGSGYVEAKGLLSGQQELSGMYPLAKMASMVGSYLPGIPGGIFAPSLSIGAGFGNLLHMLFGDISLPVLIALAMVGYLAAVTQSPITSFVIVMEMINGHALVIALMATALLASRVSRFFAPPLYEALSERYAHRHHTPQEPASAPDAGAAAPTEAAAAPAVVPDAAVPPVPVDAQVNRHARTEVLERDSDAQSKPDVPAKIAEAEMPMADEPHDSPAPATQAQAVAEEPSPEPQFAASVAPVPAESAATKPDVKKPQRRRRDALIASAPEADAAPVPAPEARTEAQVEPEAAPAPADRQDAAQPERNEEATRNKRIYRQGDLFD